MEKDTKKKAVSGILLILTAISVCLPAVMVNGVGISGIDILKTGLLGSAPESFGFYQETLVSHMRLAAIIMLIATVCPVLFGLMTCLMKSPKAEKRGMIGAALSIILFAAALVTVRMGLSHMAGLLKIWGADMTFTPGIAACVVKIILCLGAAVLAKMSAEAAKESNSEYDHDFGMGDEDLVVDMTDVPAGGYYQTVKVKKTTPAQSGITEIGMTDVAGREKQPAVEKIDIPKPVQKKPAAKPGIEQAKIEPVKKSVQEKQAEAVKIDIPKPAVKKPAAKPGIDQAKIMPIEAFVQEKQAELLSVSRAKKGALAGIDQESGHVIKLKGSELVGLLFDGHEVSAGPVDDPACVCTIRYNEEAEKKYELHPMKEEMVIYKNIKLSIVRSYHMGEKSKIYIGDAAHTFELK